MPEQMDTILLIHPDPEPAHQLTFFLQHSGFQVLTAADVDQALAHLSTTELDVILMPESLAKTNGDEPCMRIRQKCKRAPIIILGEEKQESAGIHFLDSGADTYIASPLKPRLLLAWIRPLLRRSKGNFKEYETP